MKKEKAICCKIENCTNRGKIRKNGTEIFTLGFCHAHYQKYKKYGDALIVKIVCGEDRLNNPLYSIYHTIYARCYNEKRKNYKNYGGRGIKMSEEFLGHTGFSNFCDCMGERPSKNHTIDRIDNNGDYKRGNLKWSNYFEQSKNRRFNNEFVGVSWDKNCNRWLAQICINRKHIYLGSYVEYSDACAARRAAEIKYNIYDENLGASTINP